MVIEDKFETLIKSGATSAWLSGKNSKGQPEIIRALASGVEHETGVLYTFIAEKYAKKLLENLHADQRVSLVSAHVISYISYQFKGIYLDHRKATEQEEKIQQDYVDEFIQTLNDVKFPGEIVCQGFFQRPSLMFRMQVTDIFEQTPKIGSGGKIS